jgi:hypothetical protein
MADSHRQNHAILEIDRHVLELDGVWQSFEAREIAARKELALAAAGKTEARSQIDILLQAKAVLERRTLPGIGLDLDDSDLRPIARVIAPISPQPQKRARIGTNRYFMLNHLREMSPSRVEEIASFTGLDPRRIKEQMAADLKAGNVEQVTVFVGKSPAPAYAYQLTPAGNELLTRFESYRTANGKPLPSQDGASDDDDDVSDTGDTEGAEIHAEKPVYDPEASPYTRGIAKILKEEEDYLNSRAPGVGSDAEE